MRAGSSPTRTGGAGDVHLRTCPTSSSSPAAMDLIFEVGTSIVSCILVPVTQLAIANSTDPITGPTINAQATPAISSSAPASSIATPVITEAIVAGIEYRARMHMKTPSREKLAGFGVPTTVGCSEIIPVSSGPYGSTLSQ